MFNYIKIANKYYLDSRAYIYLTVDYLTSSNLSIKYSEKLLEETKYYYEGQSEAYRLIASAYKSYNVKEYYDAVKLIQQYAYHLIKAKHKMHPIKFWGMYNTYIHFYMVIRNTLNKKAELRMEMD